VLKPRSTSFTIGTVLATSQRNDLCSLGILLRGSEAAHAIRRLAE
jgi:hypothetical protein